MTITLRPHQVRALAAMSKHDKGQIIVPTGGGKTFIMIQDCIRRMKTGPKTIVVVAPRILLANQLCDEFMQQVSNTWTHICHCHSGETKYFSSTKSEKIALFANTARAAGESVIIFTTYHSLRRVVDSGIDIDCAYFDEAHNSVTRHFFIPTAACSLHSDSTYFFTATPRTANSHSRGMNNAEIYGQVIENVPAPELINNGCIVSPTVVPFEQDIERLKINAHENDADTVDGIIADLDEQHAAKILVAVPSSRVLGNMIGKTDLLARLAERGYNVLHVTSKFGAFVNKKKVGREEFFRTLTAWGADPTKKFVIFHYSILSEGINVPGLTHCVLLRNLNVVEMAQTIGRVIRMDRDDVANIKAGKITAGALQMYKKSTGFVTVPVYKNYGKNTVERLQRVVDSIFVKGVAPDSYVR